jgi:hypothetical protein
VEETPDVRCRRKAMLQAQDGVLRHMLKMMEACNARGFVYGVIDEACAGGGRTTWASTGPGPWR